MSEMNSVAVLSGSYDYRLVVLLLLAAIVASGAALFVLSRARAWQKRNLSATREHEVYFQTMAEAVPEIIWTADPNGMDDYFNQKCFDYTGLTLEQLRGLGVAERSSIPMTWRMRLKMEKCVAERRSLRRRVPVAGEGWQLPMVLRPGQSHPESRRRNCQMVRHCTDIENQKQNQQVLEEQILERTVQLADTNTRLQEEMLEKDFARSELDQQNDRMLEELKKRSERAAMLARWANFCRVASVETKCSRPRWVLRRKYFPPSPEHWRCWTLRGTSRK